jgi:CubicO group peptidase (beta-lactamase class C family)
MTTPNNRSAKPRALKSTASARWQLILSETCVSAVITLQLLLPLLTSPVRAVAQGAESVVPRPPKARAFPAPETKPLSRHEMTSADLEAFLDGFLPYQLHRDDIAGAVIVIVKDGKILFSRGYGYADVEKKVSVIPERTMFRPGSVGKLFTWTAVMQLVEQGKLDLDRDVNDYLDFSVPHEFGKPTTLRNLMTHTPGLEEELKDSEVNKPSELPSLRSFLVGHLPRQIFPPGTIPAYSNTGAILAGYIVQRVSSQPYAEYVTEHVFKPLGMAHTSCSQPPRDIPDAFMSKPYALASEKEKPFELVSPDSAPEGGMSVTAIDMAHFMIAHLQNGEYEGRRILRDETARLMRTRQFTTDPSLPGMGLGFIGQDRNGLEIFGHDGDTNYYHSDLHLVPAANFGYFVSYNGTGNGEDARTTLWQSFLDRYFPYDAAPATTSEHAKEDAVLVSGLYISSRRQQTTFLLPLWLLLAEGSVSVNDDGTVEVDQIKAPSGKPKKWRDVGNLTFEEVNGADKIVFRRDQAGKLQLMTSDPTLIYQRVPLQWNATVLRFIVAVVLITFLLTLVLWPIAAIVRRYYRHESLVDPARCRFRRFARITSALALLLIVGFSITMVVGIGDSTYFGAKLDPWLRILQFIGLLGVLGTATVFYRAVLLWRSSGVGIWTKIYSVIFVIACIAYVWMVISFHILRPSLSY